MADNSISFNRFTTLPTNIAEFGNTVDEIKLLRGKADKNPLVGPMAAPRRSRRLLSLSPAGSDEMRLEEPTEANLDPYEGPQSTLTLSRGGHKKLEAPILGALQSLAHMLPDESTRNLMLDSFQRVERMRKYLKERNEMTESIYVRSIAASRG